jgi:hypothetical protein
MVAYACNLKQRQEDKEFKASLDYIVKLYLKKKKKKKKSVTLISPQDTERLGGLAPLFSARPLGGNYKRCPQEPSSDCCQNAQGFAKTTPKELKSKHQTNKPLKYHYRSNVSQI